jgi:radical SAM protein with 4Fe4S-binding SPASM domain
MPAAARVPGWKRRVNRADSFGRALWGGQDDETFVRAAYLEFLGRFPEPEGLRRALDELRTGSLRRGRLKRDISTSPEYRVRERFASWLRHSPCPEGSRSLAGSPPEEIWIELTTRCNIVPACLMCGYALDPASLPRKDMDPAIWRRLLPLLREARSIGLHGAGEPLLYPFLFDLLRELDPAKNETGFNSNGHLLKPKIRKSLLDSGLGWLSISLDAATPGTYLRIRRRKDFETLLGKIRALVEERNRANQRRPEVEINMTLMRLNLEEAPAFVELAADLCVDRVMFQEIHPGGRQQVAAPDGWVFDYEKEELSGCRDRHDEVMRLAHERAPALGLRSSYQIAYGGQTPWEDPPPESVKEPALPAAPALPAVALPPSVACAEPWRRLTVSVSGEVFVCCIQMTNRVVLGNVMTESPKELWNSRRARLVREAMFASQAPACCQGCYMTAGRETPTLGLDA